MSGEIQKDKFDILRQKYKKRISDNLDINDKKVDEKDHEFTGQKINSAEFEQFKKDYLPPHMNLYEKACNFSEKILKIKPDENKEQKIQDAINICHLNITPAGAVSFAVISFIFIGLFGGVLGFILPRLFNPDSTEMFFAVFFVFTGIALYPALTKLPEFLANNWRLKASNQMVLSVFYIVTYMRHTSNLELAIEFASEHLAPPLSLDLKKVLWNVETEKFESIKESLEDYLGSWRKWNMEFIESIHLIEGSLLESSEDRRINSLEKALTVMLEETYEKMLHYAHNLKSPITMLHMLGVILPILGLVILPLVVSFMEGVEWYHLAAIYNIALPIGVFYLGKIILSSRPTGYGQSDISDENPEMKKFKNIIINIGSFQLKIPPIYVALTIFIIFMIAGLSPLIIHKTNPDFDFPVEEEYTKGSAFKLLGYRITEVEGVLVEEGPFGLGAAFLSFFITLAFGIGIGLYYKLRSKNIIKLREDAKKLELEFSSALFQLGNRLGDGLPAEIAFSKVADVMEGTVSGDFFNEVSTRITKLGMGVEDAIFDRKRGALARFPSNLIESSMKVFTESIKKGPKIAGNAIINISEYVKEIHKVNERLKDLLADIISSMKSQISFLTPAISGIVIGITSMITSILGNLGDQFSRLPEQGGAAAIGMENFFFGSGIPTFYFQFIVGIYVVQIVYILTVLTNGIENGSDPLNERFLIGRNLFKSTLLYSAIAVVIMIIFNMVASTIMGSMQVG